MLNVYLELGSSLKELESVPALFMHTRHLEEADAASSGEGMAQAMQENRLM